MPITPDTKDWTWVLERRCPECGFDASETPRSAVAGLLRRSTPRWEEALRAPDVGQRPSHDRWSALEYGCHVRDVYRIYLERLRLMLDEDDPLFANWDQDETAISGGYAGQDPRIVATELASAGTELADAFDDLTSEQWTRPGRRSDGASFTIETFARYLVHDPIHHLADVGAR